MNDRQRPLILTLGSLAVIGAILLSRTPLHAIDPPVVKPPQAATDKAQLKDLALAGWRKTGGGFVVIVVNVKTREYTRLKNHEPGPDGTKVKTAHLEDRRADAFVELEREDETTIVRYDEAYLRAQARVKLIVPEEGIELKEIFMERNKFIVSGEARAIDLAKKFNMALINDAGLQQYRWSFPQPTTLENKQVSFRAEGTPREEGP